MIWALIRKELRGLRPWIGLVLLVVVVTCGWPLAFSPADQQPLSQRLYGNVVSPGIFTLVVPFSFGIGQSLLTREFSEGTIPFLDALPLQRSQVFLAKVLAGGALLCSMSAANLMVVWLLNALSRTSVESGLHFKLFATSLLMQGVVTLSVFSFALLAGWLGRPGWMLIPSAAVVLLDEHRFPVVRYLNPFELVDPEFHGDQWVVAWDVLAAQLGLASLNLLVCYGIFATRGLPGSSRLTALLARLPVRWVVFSLLMVGSTILCATGSSTKSAATEGRHGPVDWATAAPAVAVTSAYVFHFPAEHERQVRPLLAQADAIDAVVREFLDVRRGDPIHVDLAGSRRRTHGTAGWDKIKMVPPGEVGLERAVVVLGHETTHIYTFRMSDRELHSPLFVEGLAEYVDLTLFSPPEEAERRLRYAALVHHRNKISFETALDAGVLGRRWDADLSYPLGYALIWSLVQDHGRQSIGRVLRAFGREDRPDKMSHKEAWREAFQTADIGVERMAARWDELLVEVARPYAPQWDALPTPRVEVRVSEDVVELVLVEPSAVSPPGVGREVGLRCRFRRSATAGVDTYIENIPFIDGRCSVDAFRFPGPRFGHQVGIYVPEVGGTVWQEWEEGHLWEPEPSGDTAEP